MRLPIFFADGYNTDEPSARVVGNMEQEVEIEQLANLKRTLRILANEWLVQWFQGFVCLNLFARQVVPRRNPIVPHEMSVKIRRERGLLIANFLLLAKIQLLRMFLCIL